MRICGLAFALWVLAAAPVFGEWQVRPFIGFTFGGATTFVDPERAVDTRNAVIGVSGGWLGDFVGIEADFGRGPGFFENDEWPDRLVLSSAVTTLTGHVVIAVPRALAGYGLRPYFVGGAGFMHVDMLVSRGFESVNRTLPAMSIGAGVTGFLTNRVGLNWDVRRLSTLRGEGETLGQSFGDEQLSFWRATMAVAVRY